MRPVWLVALLGALMAACSGQGSTVQVTGKVVLEGESDNSGVLVSLAGRSALTDKDGAWHLDLLSGGTYILQVSASGTLEGMRAVSVEVPAEGSVSAPDVKLTPVGEVEGQATLGSSTGNAGISVLVSGSSAVAVTDDAGRYVLRGVPTGNRTLDVVTPGYARMPVQVQVRRDARVSASPVVLSRSSTPMALSATLLGASSNAGIVATLQGTEYTATTSANGSFSFPGVPDGTYTLSLRGGGYEELIPKVVFQRGEAYVDMGVLVPLAPIVMAQAKRLFTGGVTENYSYSSDGTSRPAPPFVRTADGSQLLLVGSALDVFEREGDLRLVPLAGGTPLDLAPNVSAFRLSPDGTRIVYLQNNGSLYSRPIGSGTSTLLAVLTSGYSYCCGSNRPFMISPDNTRVVFTNNGVVYSVSITGGAVTLLGPGNTSSSSDDFGTFSADGSRFFFAASSYSGSGGYGGFRVADLRNGSVQTITNSSSTNYQVTPDRNTAVVLSRDYNDKYPLYVVQLTTVGTGLTSLNVDTQVEDMRLSPDGSLLAWRTNTGAVKVMSLPAGTPVQLSTTSPMMQFSPDGKRILFTEYTAASGLYTLNSTEVAKGDKKPLWSGTSPVNHAWYSANGSWVFFQTPSGGSSGSYNPTLALNVVPTLGGTVRTLATTLNNTSFTATGTNTTRATVLASNDRVLLSYDSPTAPRTLQLFSLIGAGSLGTLGVTVDDWELTPDGANVLFTVGGALRLGLLLDGSSRVVADLVRTFRMSPDGSKVLHVDINGVGRVTTLGTSEMRVLSDRMSQGYWLDNSRVAFTRSASSSPQMFQAGLYVATVP